MTDLTTAPVASDIEDNDITMLVRIVNGIDTLYQVPASVIRGEQGIQGPKGDQGIQGIQGTRGSTWFYGTGSPSSSISPIVDDMYYDTSSCDIYTFNSSNKWVVIGNIRGLQGVQGTAGSKWYIGSGSPILSNVIDYDLYMDYGTGDVYQYLNGAWSLTNINLIGPKGEQGDQGIQGEVGSQWYFGSGSPTLTNVNDNDKYIDTSTSNIYSYSSSIWSKIGNIKGLKGDIGSQWYTGSGTPVSNTSYVINDFYLNNTTSDVYQYTSSSWVKVANIQGIQGLQGLKGDKGDKGDTGSIWYYGNVSPPSVIPNEKDLYLNGLNGDVYQYVSSVWVKIGNIRGPAGTFTNDGSDDIKINNATLYNASSLKFSSNGDNSTIDSEVIPSGGVAGTPYQGTLTVESNIFSVKNQFNSDQGNIKTDGNGNLTVLGLTINGNKAVTSDQITSFIPSNAGSNEQQITNFYWSNGQGTAEIKYGTSSAYLALKTDLSNYVSKANAIITGNLSVSGSSSLDNGDIVSNGSGTLTFMNDKNITMWPAQTGIPGIILKSSGSSTFKITDTTGADGILSCGNIISSGTTSLDSGKITTDGSGNLTVKNNLATNGYSTASYYATAAASWSNNKVYGQGSLWGWNMLSGDAYTYLWNILPSSGYNSGFKFCIGVNGTTVDGTSIVSFDKTGNIHSSGGIYTTTSSSLDNGAITTDGSGNLTTTGLLNAKTPSDVPGTSTGTSIPTTYWVDQNYLSLKNGGLINSYLNISGSLAVGYGGGWNGATANGGFRWTNAIRFGQPTASSTAFSGGFQIGDTIGNVNSSSSGINMFGYDYQNTRYNWYFAWNGDIINPKGNTVFTNAGGTISGNVIVTGTIHAYTNQPCVVGWNGTTTDHIVPNIGVGYGSSLIPFVQYYNTAGAESGGLTTIPLAKQSDVTSMKTNPYTFSSISANYTIPSSGYFVECGGSGSYTVTFPAAPTYVGGMIVIWNNTGYSMSVSCPNGSVYTYGVQNAQIPPNTRIIYMADAWNWTSIGSDSAYYA